jgi:MFS family permease
VIRALRSPNYRLFWCGSFVSNVGFWMQSVAVGWLVYEMTRSASLLGTISFCGNLPMLTLGLLGGAVADRASRRAVMLGAQVVLAAAAFTLAALTATGRIAVWHIVATAMLAGTASALYAPVMQSVIPSLVDEPDLLNAISLNSVQFNLARVVGPALAGIIYARLGPAGCFTLNACGFMVLGLALGRIRLPHRPVGPVPSVGRALRDGLRYARTHQVIWPALLLATVVALFGFPYIVLMPALARDTFHLDASGLGFLMAAVGCGAVVGGLGLSAAGDLRRKGLVAASAAVGFGIVLAALTVVHTLRGVLVLFFVMGALQVSCVASLNTTIQLAVDDRMRGRVMSMMTVILFGFVTVGGMVLGTIGDWIGVPSALAAGGVVVAIAGTTALLRAEHLVAPVVRPAARAAA